MRECNNNKIHISSNFLLSICLTIMSDTLLLVPSLHCNTSQHFATLHHTSPNYTSLHLSTLHFLSFTLHYPPIWLKPFTFPIVLFPLPSLNQTQYGMRNDATQSTFQYFVAANGDDNLDANFSKDEASFPYRMTSTPKAAACGWRL